ncbi:MAG: hypothetical protein WCI49_01450 [Ferruginibacter sp.]
MAQKTKKTNILPMLLKAMMARKTKEKNQYPAYAVKSDDGTKDQRKNQYPAYAVKSDDG